MEREKRMRKLMEGIKYRVHELKILEYSLTDRDTVICLIDNKMFNKDFSVLTEDQQSDSVVDQII